MFVLECHVCLRPPATRPKQRPRVGDGLTDSRSTDEPERYLPNSTLWLGTGTRGSRARARHRRDDVVQPPRAFSFEWVARTASMCVRLPATSAGHVGFRATIRPDRPSAGR